MKAQYKTFLVLFVLSLTSWTGCAALGLGSDSDDSTDLPEDPIAAVAARYRRSSPTEDAASRAPASLKESLTRPEHIALGMGMNEVVAVWGQPGDIETAGDPREGNQRWTYFSGLSSRWSLGEQRVVYFERGRVAGWRSAQ